MIIHTHFESLEGHLTNDYIRLLDLWKKSWENMGFTVVITDKKYILDRMSSDIVNRFCKNVESFPSVNFKGFDRASFMRWVAAYLVASEFNQSICTAEPDVINYTLSIDDVLKYTPNKFNIADRDGCPTFTYTSKEMLEIVITMISNHKFTDNDHFMGRPHLSDQDFISRYCSTLDWYNSIPELIGSVFKTAGWETMKMVHYGTPFFIEKGIEVRNKPKATSILELRAI